MKTLQLNSEIGHDGILDLHIPFSSSDAGTKVTVTIQPSETSTQTMDAGEIEWHQILNETYGAGAGLGLERPEQGKFADRESIE